MRVLVPKKNFLKFLSLVVLVLGTSTVVILANQKAVFDESKAFGKCVPHHESCGNIFGGTKDCCDPRDTCKASYIGGNVYRCYRKSVECVATEVNHWRPFCYPDKKDRGKDVYMCDGGELTPIMDCDFPSTCYVAKDYSYWTCTPTIIIGTPKPTPKPTVKPTPFSGSCKHTCVPSPECEDGGERVSGTCSYGKICCDYP